mgnify:CR=1 FL=1
MRNELLLLDNNVSVNFMYFEDGYDVMCSGCVENDVVKYVKSNKDYISSVTVNGRVSKELKDFIASNVNDCSFE